MCLLDIERIRLQHRPSRANSLVRICLHEADGKIVREAVFHRIEESHQVRRQEITRELEAFHSGPVTLLGKACKPVEKVTT